MGDERRTRSLTYGKKEEQIFLGREIAQHRDYSEETARKIDEAVKWIVLDARDKVIALLKDARLVAARLLFSGNARANPQIILLAGILDRAQALNVSMRADFIEMAIPKTAEEDKD